MAKNNNDFFDKKKIWSEVKDRLLACYLRPYFQKILMTRKPVLYIDCFAGKGKFADGNDGSPLIALKTREESLQASSVNSNLKKIDMCFIDLKYGDELQKNTAPYRKDGAIQIISGKYEEKILDLLRDKAGHNIFLYIDPYGIKALDSGLFSLFSSYNFASFEMLINFNSFGFFREACRILNVDWSKDEAFRDLDDFIVEYDSTKVDSTKESEALLTSIAGGDYWKAIAKDYRDGKITGYQAEKKLSSEYKKWLSTKFAYVLDLPIRMKAGQQPKYRMVHVSNHEDGCFLMAQNMLNRKEEIYKHIQKDNQCSLLDGTLNFVPKSDGAWISKEELTKVIRSYLDGIESEINITKFIAGFISKTGILCELKNVYAILEELQTQEYLGVRRRPPVTKNGNVRKFWDEKKGKKVILKRVIQ